MKTFYSLSILFCLSLSTAQSARSEYRDLRSPKQVGSGTFTGAASFCAPCSGGLSRSQVKEAAIQDAKNSGAQWCQELGAIGVNYSDIQTQRISHAFYNIYTSSVKATCKFR